MKKFYFLTITLVFLFSGFQLTAANTSQKSQKKSVKTYPFGHEHLVWLK